MTLYAFSGNFQIARPVEDRLFDRALLLVVTLAGFSLERFLHYPHPPEGDPVSRLFWTAIYFVALGGVIVDRKTAARLLRGSLPVLLILLITVLSTVWSQDAEQTAKESLGLVGTGLIALYFACRLSLKSLLETLSVAIVISAVISTFLIAFVPDTGRMAGDEYNGVWQGSFVDKNHLGRSMVLGMFTVMCTMGQSRGFPKALQLFAVILFGVLLAGSHSISFVFVCGALALIIPLLFRSRSIGTIRPALVGLAASFLVVAYLVFAVGADEILGIFGRDTTFTGRTELWQFAIDGISQQPILGYGYSTFLNPYTPTGNSAVRALGWESQFFMAHNGFLEVTLGTGLLGLAFVTWTLIVGFKRTGTLFWQRRDLYTAWPLLFAIYSLLGNLTEASIALVNDINWILYLVAFLIAIDAHQRGRSFHADESARSLNPGKS